MQAKTMAEKFLGPSETSAINEFSFGHLALSLFLLCVLKTVECLYALLRQRRIGRVHQQTDENGRSRCNRDQHIEWKLIEAPYATRYLHKFSLYTNDFCYGFVFLFSAFVRSLNAISLLHWLLSLWHSCLFFFGCLSAALLCHGIMALPQHWTELNRIETKNEFSSLNGKSRWLIFPFHIDTDFQFGHNSGWIQMSECALFTWALNSGRRIARDEGYKWHEKGPFNNMRQKRNNKKEDDRI